MQCFEASEWNSSAKNAFFFLQQRIGSCKIFSVNSFDYLSFREVSTFQFHSEFMLHNDNVVGSVKPFETKYYLTSIAADCLVNAPAGANTTEY